MFTLQYIQTLVTAWFDATPEHKPILRTLLTQAIGLDVDTAIKMIFLTEGRIPAIKLYRQHNQAASLIEAKDAVADLTEQLLNRVKDAHNLI